MDNSARMAQLQTKGAGAPPQEPPMTGGVPPEGGAPPPEMVIPKIAELLQQMSASLPPDKQALIMDAASKLQSAFPANPSEGAGMPADDAAAYGEAQ